MKTAIGMRGKDLRSLMMIARQFNVVILVRHTNDSSLRFVGMPGYYPKPALVKAKTADMNPSPVILGGTVARPKANYDVAGLVVHPGFQNSVFGGKKLGTALDYWRKTMEVLAPELATVMVDLRQPETLKVWGVERQAANAPRWKWRIDIDPESNRFGSLQLKGANVATWSYIYGDYDLKDVICLGSERINKSIPGFIDTVKNFTPELNNGLSFEIIQEAINNLIGVDLVQHGSEAQFAWHGDEPITAAYPDWTFKVLGNAESVQKWYEEIGREICLDDKKKEERIDYLRDPNRSFVWSPGGWVEPEKYRQK